MMTLTPSAMFMLQGQLYSFTALLAHVAAWQSYSRKPAYVMGMCLAHARVTP